MVQRGVTTGALLTTCATYSFSLHGSPANGKHASCARVCRSFNAAALPTNVKVEVAHVVSKAREVKASFIIDSSCILVIEGSTLTLLLVSYGPFS